MCRRTRRGSPPRAAHVLGGTCGWLSPAPCLLALGLGLELAAQLFEREGSGEVGGPQSHHAIAPPCQKWQPPECCRSLDHLIGPLQQRVAGTARVKPSQSPIPCGLTATCTWWPPVSHANPQPHRSMNQSVIGCPTMSATSPACCRARP